MSGRALVMATGAVSSRALQAEHDANRGKHAGTGAFTGYVGGQTCASCTSLSVVGQPFFRGHADAIRQLNGGNGRMRVMFWRNQLVRYHASMMA
jgi:hypothetical protein